MDKKAIIKASEALSDSAEEEGCIIEVSDTIEMLESCNTLEECKEWIKDNI